MVFNILAPPLIGSGMILIFIAAWSWSFRNTPGAKPFALLSLCCAVYSLGYAMEISSATLEAMLFWLRVEYVGIALLPAFLLLFALTYTSRSNRISPPVLVAIFVIPLLTLIIFYTNAMHELYYQAVRLSTEGPFPVIDFEKGPWYWVQVGYIGFATLLSNFLFLQMWLYSTGVYRRQMLIFLVGSLVPWGVHLIYVTGQIGWNLDLSPFALTFSGLLFFWGFFRYRLFELIPAARAALFEELPDGVLILDGEMRILDINAAARQYLKLQADAIGRPAPEVLQGWPQLTPLLGDTSQKHQLQLQQDTSCGIRSFNFELVPLQDEGRIVNGQIILLRDITTQRRAEVALQQSERKLKAAFESTHDAITISSADGKLVDCNQRALEIFGLADKADFLAYRPADFHHQNSRTDGIHMKPPANLLKRP